MKWITINAVSHGLTDHISTLRELSREIESITKRKIAKIEEDAKKLEEIEDEDYRDHMAEGIHEELHHYQNDWIEISRESLFLSLCSSFEFYIGRIADAYARSAKSSFRIKHLSDRGIKAARSLLTHLDLDTSAFGVEWNSLTEIYKIRNKIAHSGSRVSDDIEKTIKKLDGLFIIDELYGKRIKLKEDAIDQICDLMIEAKRKILRTIMK